MKNLKAMIKEFEEAGSLEDQQKSEKPQTFLEVVDEGECDAVILSTSYGHGECSACTILLRTGIYDDF